MAKLEVTFPAQYDALEIWHYIAAHNDRAADEVLNRLDACFQFICQSPRIGRQRPELGRGFRSYPVGNYVVIYRVAPRSDRVLILRVVHGARDLRRVFNRRKP